jgi:hypothetical protein
MHNWSLLTAIIGRSLANSYEMYSNAATHIRHSVNLMFLQENRNLRRGFCMGKLILLMHTGYQKFHLCDNYFMQSAIKYGKFVKK